MALVSNFRAKVIVSADGPYPNINGLVAEPNQHGHQSISIMSSTTNNGFGIAGINWTSNVKVENVISALSVQQGIQDGLDYASARNMRVVFQASIEREPNAADVNAVKALLASSNGYALYAFAAGNHNSDIDSTATNRLNPFDGPGSLDNV